MGTPNQRVPRLKDVAAAAKVSTAAASRILSGDHSEFSEATCRRVTETARKLGWRRNLLVKSIQQGKTRMIGVLIPPHDSFWVAVLAGIHMELANADYLPITVWIGDCRETPNLAREEKAGVDQINRLLDRRVDGLILWPSFASVYYHHYRELIEQRVPVVVIDHKLSEEDLADSIETDEKLGARLAAEHLINLGHRKIGCFSATEADWQAWSVRRRTLFEQVVSEYANVDVKSWKTNVEGTNAPEVARQILMHPKGPTGVFAVSDHLAQHLYHAAYELGLNIPGDVSVVGYADLDFAAGLSPPLTTIRQQPEKVGRLAAQAVLDRLESEDLDQPAKVHRVPVELVVRTSTTELCE